MSRPLLVTALCNLPYLWLRQVQGSLRLHSELITNMKVLIAVVANGNYAPLSAEHQNIDQ